MNKTEVIFISYDGMTDPLGQSQVLPYIIELGKRGYQFHLVSCEKPANFKLHADKIKAICEEAGIKWHPLEYEDEIPVLSSVMNVRKISKAIKNLCGKYDVKMIHSRSYIPAIPTLRFKRKYGVKFLFDMRGFWPDERVDGGIWNLKKSHFKQVYKYFKKKEVEFIKEADYIISLTEKAKEIIYNWEYVDTQKVKIEVIPCCADLELFSPSKIDTNHVSNFKRDLSISERDFIVTYLGSIGSWYMLDEMMEFFLKLKEKKSNAKFLFITKDNPDVIMNCAKKLKVDKDDIIIQPCERSFLPSLLSLSAVSIFFIKPAFSKQASSPTKMAELIGMGIPIICNANVGDSDVIVRSEKVGIVVEDFKEEAYEIAINNLEELSTIPQNHLRAVAEKHFSLEMGAARYARVYSEINS